MRQLYIKQKVMSLSGKFTVKDAEGNDVYFVEGSFLQVPKRFSVMDVARQEVALITNQPFSFLPTFLVDVQGHQTMTIKKRFSFLKARYTIDAAGIEVQGNWWDMDFQVYQNRTLIGSVNKNWFTWGDSYELEIAAEEMESLMVALVVSIDCAKAAQNAGAGGRRKRCECFMFYHLKLLGFE